MREALISENPYRLLTLASDTPYTRLRKKADAAVKGASVGIASYAALTDKFGEGDFEALESNIRSLATDPVKRTCYRLLWPLQTKTLAALLDGGHLQTSHVPNYAIAQACFLEAWFEFIVTHDPEELRSALEHFSDFGADEEGDELLTSLLAEEDRLLEADAYDHVLAAQVKVAKYILTRAAGIAADLARKENLNRSCAIVKVILQSPLDKEEEGACLGRIVDFGNQLAEKVSCQAREITWKDDSPPEVVARLVTLGTAIGDRHPATKSWMDAVERCTSILVTRWINRAVDLVNDEGKNHAALEILERCRCYSVAPDVAARLNKNLQTVRENLAGKSARTSKTADLLRERLRRLLPEVLGSCLAALRNLRLQV